MYHFARMAAADQSFDHFYTPHSELTADLEAFCLPESFASKHGLTAGSHDTKKYSLRSSRRSRRRSRRQACWSLLSGCFICARHSNAFRPRCGQILEGVTSLIRCGRFWTIYFSNPVIPPHPRCTAYARCIALLSFQANRRRGPMCTGDLATRRWCRVQSSCMPALRAALKQPICLAVV